MQVRSVTSLTIAIALLASSSILGLMVHDAEVGGPEAASLSTGDAVRLRGDLDPVKGPDDDRAAAWLKTDAWPGQILVTSDDELPTDGVWVVSGEVLWSGQGQDGPLLIVEATHVTAPIWFS